jgi:hypothetical protein
VGGKAPTASGNASAAASETPAASSGHSLDDAANAARNQPHGNGQSASASPGAEAGGSTGRNVGVPETGAPPVSEPIPLTKAAFGHTFTTHGQDSTEFLTRRAAGAGQPMGQFLDDQAAARFIQENLDKVANGAVSIPIPPGFPARVIMPDGSFAPATSIRLVPSGNGVKTAYPER